MRILSISNCPLVESQGSGYIIINFCQGLRDCGHQVDLYGPESYEPLKFLKGRATQYRQSIGIFYFTLKQILQNNYDVIEFYGAESWLTIYLLKKLPRRNFLLVCHSNGLETYCNNTLLEYARSGYIQSPFYKMYQINPNSFLVNAFTQADALVTVSKNELNYAIKNNYKKRDRAIAIENCLPEQYLELNIDFHRTQIIGFCGSWLARKGIRTIVEDISKILSEFPNCSLKLIGVGKNFDKKLCFPASVCEQIDIIPFINRDDLKKVYQSLSILIFPSLYESFGLVAAEAMACGCAVVGSMVGFVATLEHRQEAFIIEKPISPFLYQGVKELLLNDSLRIKIAQNGYQRVQKLRWSLAIEKIENAYLNWLQEIGNSKNSLK